MNKVDIAVTTHKSAAPGSVWLDKRDGGIYMVVKVLNADGFNNVLASLNHGETLGIPFIDPFCGQEENFIPLDSAITISPQF